MSGFKSWNSNGRWPDWDFSSRVIWLVKKQQKKKRPSRSHLIFWQMCLEICTSCSLPPELLILSAILFWKTKSSIDILILISCVSWFTLDLIGIPIYFLHPNYFIPLLYRPAHKRTILKDQCPNLHKKALIINLFSWLINPIKS